MNESRLVLSRIAIALIVVVAMLGAGLTLSSTADAGGPPYSGPTTEATGPAYFGPAPNPIPYCENPVYFDPFPENVNPIGRIDPNGAPNASVTTNDITMTFELTAEGSPDSQYPGFFPEGGDGGDSDQPKGVEMAFGDAAEIRLSQPLFYTQWVFTDVDRENEGFFVDPVWTSNPGQVAVFGGDAGFDFSGTTSTQAVFNDSDPGSEDSESLAGRVQVDFLGAVVGIDLLRDIGSGQSGFAVGGGCEPVGVAKELTAPPVWNGTSFDVTYTIRVRNNLPSAATIGADIAAAQAAAASTSDSTGIPIEIDLTELVLSDLLTNDAFEDVIIIRNDSASGNIATSDTYNGTTDTSLLAAGETIPPETEEEFILELQYVPVATGPLGPTCAASYELLNQAQVDGVADGVGVTDLSDDGADPDPGADNGDDNVNTPTVVTFDCPPAAVAGLEIVKTVLAGADATCPSFADGQAGPGTPLEVTVGDTVTYCISVRNTSDAVDLTDVVVSDPQAPDSFDGTVGDLAATAEDTVQFNLVVADATPATNTAAATGNDPAGPVPEVTDTAVIDPVVPVAGLEIVKTVLAGADAVCPSFADGQAGPGTALDVFIGDTVTYCISVRNTSDAVDLTDVVVSDPQAPDSFDGTVGDLAATAEDTVQFNLVVTETTPATNTASATGNGPAGPVPEVTDTAVIVPTEVPINPSISLTKTVLAGAGADCSAAVEGVDEFVLGAPGDPITWCFVVTNTGDVPLANILFNDLPAEITNRDLLIGAPSLAPGETIELSVDGTIPATGLENVASVAADPADDDGTPLPNVDPVGDENPAAVQAAEITLSKTVVGGADADCATATDFAAVNIGSEVTYCFAISNTGGVPVLVEQVDDATLGITVPIPAAEQLIAPGATVVVSFSTTATTDLVNTASATGVPIDPATNEPFPDGPVLQPEDPAEVDTLQADLSLVKSNASFTQASRGQTIPYTIEITNNGPDSAVNVVVVDQLPDGLTLVAVPVLADWSCSQAGQTLTCNKATDLAAGDTVVVTYDVSVDLTAPDATSLVNTASVSSDTPDPDPTNNDDTESTEVAPPVTNPDETIGIVVITNAPPIPQTPFTVPPVSVPETAPLAITGAQSSWLILASTAMTAIGGTFFVAGRRWDDEDLA